MGIHLLRSQLLEVVRTAIGVSSASAEGDGLVPMLVLHARDLTASEAPDQAVSSPARDCLEVLVLLVQQKALSATLPEVVPVFVATAQSAEAKTAELGVLALLKASAHTSGAEAMLAEGAAPGSRPGLDVLLRAMVSPSSSPICKRAAVGCMCNMVNSDARCEMVSRLLDRIGVEFDPSWRSC